MHRNCLHTGCIADDDKVRQVVVRHEQLQEEEIYPCSQGVAYIRIYTNDAAILFQDDKQRRYAATIPYNLKKLTDEESVTSELLKLGVEEPGLLLHYCEKAEMNRENLAYFQLPCRIIFLYGNIPQIHTQKDSGILCTECTWTGS